MQRMQTARRSGPDGRIDLPRVPRHPFRCPPNQCPVGKLPNELLCKITKYLRMRDIKCFRLVCSRWYHAGTTRIKNSSFVFRFHNLDQLRRFAGTFSSPTPVLPSSNHFSFLSGILSSTSSNFYDFGPKFGNFISICDLEIKEGLMKNELNLRLNVCYLLAHAVNLVELKVTANDDVGSMDLPVFPKLRTLRVEHNTPSLHLSFMDELSMKVPALSSLTLNVRPRKLPRVFQTLANNGHNITCRLTLTVTSRVDISAIRHIATNYSPLLKVTEIMLSFREDQPGGGIGGGAIGEFRQSFSDWLAQQSGSLRSLSLFDYWNIIDGINFPALPLLEEINFGESPHHFMPFHSIPCSHFPALKTLSTNLKSLSLFSGGGGNLENVKKLWLSATIIPGDFSVHTLFPNVESLELITTVAFLNVGVRGFHKLVNLEMTLDDSGSDTVENLQWFTLTGFNKLFTDEEVLNIPVATDIAGSTDEMDGNSRLLIWSRLKHLKINKYTPAIVRALVYLGRTRRMPKLQTLVLYRGRSHAPIHPFLLEDLESRHITVKIKNG